MILLIMKTPLTDHQEDMIEIHQINFRAPQIREDLLVLMKKNMISANSIINNKIRKKGDIPMNKKMI